MNQSDSNQRWPFEPQYGELADIRQAMKLQEEVEQLQSCYRKAIQDSAEFPTELAAELERKTEKFRAAVLRAYPNQQFRDQ